MSAIEKEKWKFIPYFLIIMGLIESADVWYFRVKKKQNLILYFSFPSHSFYLSTSSRVELQFFPSRQIKISEKASCKRKYCKMFPFLLFKFNGFEKFICFVDVKLKVNELRNCFLWCFWIDSALVLLLGNEFFSENIVYCFFNNNGMLWTK